MIEFDLAVPVATRAGPQRVAALWTAPSDEPPAGLVILYHAFTRGPQHLRGIAAGLAAAGVACVRPRVASLRRTGSFNDREFLTALALGLADLVESGEGRARLDEVGLPLAGVPRIVLAGHSAGAAVALHQAAVLRGRASRGDQPGWRSGHGGGDLVEVAGLLLLDGADTATRAAAAALPAVAAVPVRVIVGRPSPCNRHGDLVDRLAVGRSGFLGVRLVAGGHGDAEDAGGGAYRLACGDRTAAEDRAVVHRLAVTWGRRLLDAESGGSATGAGPADPWLHRLAADGRLVLLHA